MFILLFLYFYYYFYSSDASVKDMEAASVAWTANLSLTPFFALKVVTDIVDSDQDITEVSELHKATDDILQIAMINMLNYVINKQLDEL